MELELRTLVSDLEGKETEQKYLELAKNFYTTILSQALDKVAESFQVIDLIDIILEHSAPTWAMSESGCVKEGMTEVFVDIPVMIISPDGDANEDYEFTVYELWKKRFNSKLYCEVEEPINQFDWSILNKIDWGIWGLWMSWDLLSVRENYHRFNQPYFYNNRGSDCFGNTNIYDAA